MSAETFLRLRTEHSASVAMAGLCALICFCGLAFGDEIEEAIEFGDLQEVKEMAQADPHFVNSKVIYGETPLILAATYGQRDIAEWLLNNHADIEAGDSNGATALDWASGRSHENVVALLLERGAKVNAKTEDDFTALESASMSGDKEVVELLLDHGADVNARGDEGMTPLLRAACTKSTDVVELLLAHGADVNATDALHESALAKAIQYSTKEMVMVLLFSRGGWIRTNYLWLTGTTGTAIIMCFLYFRYWKRNGRISILPSTSRSTS